MEQVVGDVDTTLRDEASALLAHEAAHDPGQPYAAVAVLLAPAEQRGGHLLRHGQLPRSAAVRCRGVDGGRGTAHGDEEALDVVGERPGVEFRFGRTAVSEPVERAADLRPELRRLLGDAFG